MRKHLVATLLVSTAIGFAAPAWAQDAETDEGTSPADIVVTARRVEERLQDVPISITVFNQAQLDKANITSARELSTYTPSLSTNARFGADSASFAIRGFTQENRTTASVGVYFADVVAPRGGGATGAGGDGAGPGSMFDLQNVQVLKGPQGTLFGRNTTGGAVLLVPKKPTRELEGYVEGSYGNYDMKRLQGVLNVPFGDSFRVRAGVDWQKSDGWQKNYSGVGPKRFSNTDYIAARLSAVIDLTPELENYTVVSYSKSTPNGSRPKLTDCFRTGLSTSGSFANGMGNFVCEQIARERNLSDNSISNWLPWASTKQVTWQIVNTTTWQASDSLTIKNITSYAQVAQDQASDLFGIGVPLGTTVNLPSAALFFDPTFATMNFNYVPYAVPAAYQGGYIGSSTVASPPGHKAGEQSTFTEELQFQGRAFDGRLNWQGGAYFELSKPLDWSGTQSMELMHCANEAQWANLSCTSVFPAIIYANIPSTALALGMPLLGGSMNKQLAKTTYRNVGLYAQGSFDITDSLKATAGFRYTWDRTTSSAMRATYNYLGTDLNGDGNRFNDPTGTCFNPLLAYNGNLANCTEYMKQSSKAPTWVLGLDYKLNRDMMVYAKWARGYRQGASNPYAPVGFYSFEPEKVDTYEAGIKTSFRGAISGTFNVSAFYNNFQDQQLEVAFQDDIDPYPAGDSRNVRLQPNVAIVNAGKSEIYGVEVEGSLTPFRGFTLSASYAYLKTKLKEFTAPVLPNESVAGYSGADGYDKVAKAPVVGNPLPYSPKHKLVLDARYVLPLDESVGKVTLGGTYVYTSKIFYGDFTYNPALISDTIVGDNNIRYGTATELVNFNVGWEGIMGSPVDASFFMTNAFNEKYYMDRSASGSRGYVLRYQATPRTYGVRLRYSF